MAISVPNLRKPDSHVDLIRIAGNALLRDSSLLPRLALEDVLLVISLTCEPWDNAVANLQVHLLAVANPQCPFLFLERCSRHHFWHNHAILEKFDAKLQALIVKVTHTIVVNSILEIILVCSFRCTFPVSSI